MPPVAVTDIVCEPPTQIAPPLGWLEMDGPATTVIVTVLEVTLPQPVPEAEITTRYWEVPATKVPDTVRLAVFAPEYDAPSGKRFITSVQSRPLKYCHWYVRLGVPPVAATVNVWLPPMQMAPLVGWLQMAGSATTVTVCELDTTVPQPPAEYVANKRY